MAIVNVAQGRMRDLRKSQEGSLQDPKSTRLELRQGHSPCTESRHAADLQRARKHGSAAHQE